MLFLKVQSGEANEQENQRYLDLLKDPQLCKQMQAMESCWQELEAFPIELQADFDLPAVQGQGSSATLKYFPKALFATAAALLVTVLILFQYNNENAPLRYQTTVGETAQYTLPDGSVIYLNGASLLETDFDNEHRHLQLQRGEALFEVAKDASRPFIVQTRNGQVQAIGTAFNVNLLPGRLAVTVIEGTIMVKNQQQSEQNAKAEVATINQHVVINPLGNITVTTVDDVNIATAWRDGKLIFSGEPLHQVLESATRHSNQRIDILDSRLKNLPVYGIFNTGDINGLLDALETGYPLTAVKNNSGSIYLVHRTQPNKNI